MATRQGGVDLAAVTSTAGRPFLPTKLFVPVPGDAVLERQRLHTALDAGASASLVLVSAPAGYGKTTLVADWVRGARRAVGWISLDAGDDDPATFLDYTARAVEALSPAAAERAQALLASTPPPEPMNVAAALAADVAVHGAGGILVLDDYHEITDAQVHQVISFLVERAPSITVVLITRNDPPLPLARLRARGRLCEIRESDLRFDTGEAGRFVECLCDRPLPPDAVAALAERTEGWAAGLQLAGLALRQAADTHAFVAGFQGTHIFIADYLADEVLSGVPEQQQRFLIRSSLLNRLTGPLCDAALGMESSHTLLEVLDRANLFLVPLDSERRWFRYHHLFADLLRRRALAEPEAVREDILRRAAAWCDENGAPDDAVSYALRAKLPAFAADIVARNGLEALAAGEALKALRWTSALPDELVHGSPDHCVIAAWSSTLVERYERVGPLAERSLELLERGERAHPWVDDVALHTRVLLAGAAGLNGTPAHDVLQRLRDVLEEAPPANLLLRSSAEIMCGKVLCHAGHYEEALVHHDRARDHGANAGSELLRLAAVTGRAKTLLLHGQLRRAVEEVEAELSRRRTLREILGSQVANLQSMLALAHLEQHDVEAAAAALQRAWAALGADPEDPDAWRSMLRFDRVRHTAFHSMSPMAFFGTHAHVRLLMRQGRLADAVACADAMESSVPLPAPPGIRAVLDGLRVRIWIAQGDAARLRQWLRQEPLPPTGSAFWDDIARLTRARACLATGDLASADHFAGMVAESSAYVCRANAMVLNSLIAAADGRPQQAVRLAAEALELTVHQNRAGPWLETGPAAVPLLEQALGRDVLSPTAAAFAATLLARIRELTPARVTGPDHALSDREVAVLRLVAAGHSNQQIAKALFLAVGTVKKHTHNIYGKLGVSNRTAAVNAARELGLLHDTQQSRTAE